MQIEIDAKVNSFSGSQTTGQKVSVVPPASPTASDPIRMSCQRAYPSPLRWQLRLATGERERGGNPRGNVLAISQSHFTKHFRLTGTFCGFSIIRLLDFLLCLSFFFCSHMITLQFMEPSSLLSVVCSTAFSFVIKWLGNFFLKNNDKMNSPFKLSQYT